MGISLALAETRLHMEKVGSISSCKERDWRHYEELAWI
jgi:hypothetical protein